MRFAHGLALVSFLFIFASVFAQTENTQNQANMEIVNSKLDVLINQYSGLAKNQAEGLANLPDKNEVSANFGQLDQRMSDKINAQFPNLVIILIGNNLIVVGAILLLKRYRVI